MDFQVKRGVINLDTDKILNGSKDELKLLHQLSKDEQIQILLQVAKDEKSLHEELQFNHVSKWLADAEKSNFCSGIVIGSIPGSFFGIISAQIFGAVSAIAIFSVILVLSFIFSFLRNA